MRAFLNKRNFSNKKVVGEQGWKKNSNSSTPLMLGTNKEIVQLLE